MPTKSLAAALDLCGKAVRSVLATGKSMPQDRERIMQGRLAVERLIRDLASENSKYKEELVAAMHALNPDVEYVSRFALIRDLADVCLTLERFENGKSRSIRSKGSEASLACEYLKDELVQSN